MRGRFILARDIEDRTYRPHGTGKDRLPEALHADSHDTCRVGIRRRHVLHTQRADGACALAGERSGVQ